MNDISIDELIEKLRNVIKNIKVTIKTKQPLIYDDVLVVIKDIENIIALKCNNTGFYDLKSFYRELKSFISYIRSMTNSSSNHKHHLRMLKKIKEILSKYTDLGSNNEVKQWKRRVRKEITHRNGKPMLTMKMIRELKEYVNPLEQLILIINNCFPSLIKDFCNLSDSRHQSYIEYQTQEITLIRMLALCCGIQSMAEIVTKLNRNQFIENINKILNIQLDKFPSDDTISRVMNIIELEELEKIQAKIVRRLIESKTLDRFRLFNKSFHVVIDGSGLFTTRKDLGTGCIYKVHNKGNEDEYTEYQYYVLEAKLICGSYVFSFATEFVENAKMDTEKEKQDCELKAAHRLLEKIRKHYPKLPITIGGDALYVNKPFMDACKKYKMDFILRYKSTVMKTLYEEFINIEKTVNGNCLYVNEIGFGSGTKDSEGVTNIISCMQVQKKQEKEDVIIDATVVLNDTDFMFVTSININNKNCKDIIRAGRNRWKIENQGFKDQKSRIINIGHCYTFDNNGTKVNYFFMQFAHTLLTLLYYGSSIIKKLRETKVEVANLLYQALIHDCEINLENTIQIRFD